MITDMALRLAWKSEGRHPEQRPRTAGRQLGQFVGPKRLFVALDGRDVTISGHGWHVEVYGVVDEVNGRWIQLAVRGQNQYMVTFRLRPGAGVQHAVLALASWLAHWPSENEILNVA